jgi:uncharacterized membrane protein YfcA
VSWSIDLALALTALVGLSLGLLGGGGSILAVPVLVYVAHIAPADAIGMSLVIVGATSVAGSVAHARAGAVEWRAALPFAGAGVLTAFAGGLLTRLVPGRVLLLGFAALMIAVGGWMLLRGRRRTRPAAEAPPRPPRPGRALVAGALVGGITGFLGVGGGFLVVPALIAFTGLDMRRAVGTSLVVIAINSAAALAAHLGGGELHALLAVAFTALAVGGALVGARLGRKLPADRLRAAFATFVVAVGVTMALRTGLGG